MKKHIGMVVLAALVVAALLLTTVTYKVDELRDIVVVKTFGRITGVNRGARDAGLRFKWPWPIQSVVRYDARTYILENADQEVPTRDKQNILATMFCAWRIDDARKFHTSVQTVKDAEGRLRQRLQNFHSIISEHMLSEFVNTDVEKMRIAQVEQAICDKLRADAADYGIAVDRVGLKVLGLSEGVSAAVIDAQKAERDQEARKFKAAGEADATAIKERAKEASAIITAFAKRKAADIMSEAYAAAASTYAQLSSNEPLSMFLRSLESLKKELQSRAVIILDASELPAVRFFSEGPSVDNLGVPGAASGKAATRPATQKQGK